MATIHGAVKLDKVLASAHGNIFSLTDAVNDHDNGTVGFVGDLVAGQQELFQLTQANSTNINSDNMVFVASPEITYLAGQVITDFYNPAGSAMRGYVFHAGDIVTVTNNMITGSPAVDQYLAPANGSWNLNVSASLPTTRFVARIIDTSATIAGQPATTFVVVKN